MKRREFIGGLAGATVWPPLVRAQVSGLRHIGLLMGGRGEADPEGQARLGVIKQRFQELGWDEGRNLRLTSRWAAGRMARIEALASIGQRLALGPSEIKPIEFALILRKAGDKECIALAARAPQQGRFRKLQPPM